jgi:hypothetical protein
MGRARLKAAAVPQVPVARLSPGPACRRSRAAPETRAHPWGYPRYRGCARPAIARIAKLPALALGPICSRWLRSAPRRAGRGTSDSSTARRAAGPPASCEHSLSCPGVEHARWGRCVSGKEAAPAAAMPGPVAPHTRPARAAQGGDMSQARSMQQAATDMLAQLLQTPDPAAVANANVARLDEQFFAIASTYIAMVRPPGLQTTWAPAAAAAARLPGRRRQAHPAPPASGAPLPHPSTLRTAGAAASHLHPARTRARLRPLKNPRPRRRATPTWCSGWRAR